MKDRHSIRISGFGGQGIVLSGYVIGRAASLYDNKNAAFTQSYGPEARGGACAACVVIEPGAIGYPLVKDADFFIALSKEAYHQHADRVTPKGLIFVDSELVEDAAVDNKKIFGLPVTRLAEELGKKIVANIIMLGFFFSITKIISREAMLKSIKTSVKKGFLEINFKAFELGYKHGSQIQKR